MDFLYENLSDERFQEFCGILISKEFPNSQMYPIGQPDGGRDVLVYNMANRQKEFSVFQVKFVRNPEKIRDPHKWLIQILEEEVKKIDTLIPKGAKAYYLMTNVRGTGHLETGSKDKLNKILESNIKIPAICWWREDITMLFEKDPIFKWGFPEILSGQDILNSTLFNQLNENKERRESVIRAYLADQYRQDNEVKFRQVDLQNRLLDLYTDVPLRIKKYDEKNKKLRRTLNLFESKNYPIREHEDSFLFEILEPIGAAAFLLHPIIQDGIQRILLEGGPGQGKSTISQYVCQVHRARLLNIKSDIDTIPENFKNTPLRLPIKIDLRHIAAWVENKNPYQGILNEEHFNKVWNKSLESFLVGHIFYHSKLEEFTSNDFVSICKLSPMLFVFDGFDEIANLEVRKEVIDFINKGLNRISENSKSLQVIITSRPSVFSDSLGFSINMYPHFELTSITSEVTKEYVSKWIRANRLDNKEASEIKRLVNEKLELPHLKELAKSPMQLAIFISLLRKKGESLPNRRTALYDSYIELFFDRESEKSSMIRDHRDLIIDIHQYLAWVLHSEAELYKNSGSIRIEDLVNLLKRYLITEGHVIDIAGKLFDVVKDRVCALASRVQGTFEFEVQPLREYFCAKYLYKTSPYSPAGKEKPGTLPDRFDGISRNIYWLNVARFFAGCFSKGELSMLIQKLTELQEDRDLKYTNVPRLLTGQLLSDYVFTQYPVLLKEVVKIILDGINIGNIINQDSSRGNTNPIIVPPDCGRAEIVAECFKELKKFPGNHYAHELIGIIKNNPFNTIDNWNSYVLQLASVNLTKWLEYAYLLEIIHKLDERVLISILEEDMTNSIVRRIQILLNGNRLDLLYKNATLKSILFRNLLDCNLHFFPKQNTGQSLEFLALIIESYHYLNIFNKERQRISLVDYLSLRNRTRQRTEEEIKLLTSFHINDDIDSDILKYFNSIKDVIAFDISEWKNNIEPWDILIENGRNIFNDCWSFKILATISAGIKLKDEKLDGFDNLIDNSISLCKRARYARMKSGNIKYWENNLNVTTDLTFTLLVFFTWATPRTIIALLPSLSEIIPRLSKSDYTKLIKGLYKTTNLSIFTSSQQTLILRVLKTQKTLNSLVYILSIRFEYYKRGEVIYENISDFSNMLVTTKHLKLDYLVTKYLSDVENKVLLNQIKLLYGQLEGYRSYIRTIDEDKIEIPLEIAEEIMSNCKLYPGGIVSLAERSCRIKAYANLIPVGEIAKRENWFPEH